MRFAILTLMILATALSGCVSDDALPDDSDAATDGVADTTESNQQAATGPPLLPAPPDLWGDETELVLVDETHNPSDRFYPTCNRVVGAGVVQCAVVRLQEGTLLPHGTASLTVDADASNSQGNGDLSTDVFQTAGRTSDADESLEGDSQSGTDLSWTFEMTPQDWDPVGAETSSLQINVWNDGEFGLVGARAGSFHVPVTAHRDPEWEPVSPGPDPWFDHPSLIDPDGIRLLDTNVSETVGAIDVNGVYGGFEARLDHPIPPTSVTVLLGIQSTALSCAPASTCFFVADTMTESSTYYQPHDPPEHGEGWTVLQINLPSPGLSPDSPDADESATWFWLYAHQCDPVMSAYQTAFPASNCLPMLNESTVDARVIIEAWRAEPDLDAIKERLGV